MLEIQQTQRYSRWFRTIRDRATRARMDVRIRRLSLGNPGDVKAAGEGFPELRIDYGPGYRVYFVHRRNTCVLLLAGGDKSSQASDIQAAKMLARHH